MYDFIGDLHGRYDALVKLLSKLGYADNKGVWTHPKRKVFFLGDLIDNGNQINETLKLVRSMVTEGQALAILGNHEFNLIGYHTKSRELPETYLRVRKDENTKQCERTTSQLSPVELDNYLNWFCELPIYHQGSDFRAVHACWKPNHIAEITNRLNGKNKITYDSIHNLYEPGNKLCEAVEITLKGPEIKLPEGVFIKDKYKKLRGELRLSWWSQSDIPTGTPDNFNYSKHIESHQDQFYPIDAPPVFFGHYYKAGNPQPYLTSKNAQCLDFGLEKGGGYLACYRFDGEQILDSKKLVWVNLD